MPQQELVQLQSLQQQDATAREALLMHRLLKRLELQPQPQLHQGESEYQCALGCSKWQRLWKASCCGIGHRQL
jgi:hypothetical protein